MPSYEQFMMRHGEHGVQDLVERLEKYEGISRKEPMALEDRWNALMQEANSSATAV